MDASTCPDDSERYIGRLGLFDDDQAQLLVDWRAPAARDLLLSHVDAAAGRCRASTASGDEGQGVSAIYDDVLDLDVFEARPDLIAHTSESTSLTTDGALLAALNARCTGRMGDIVATIPERAGRDRFEPRCGECSSYKEWPTGKTAVALHRAAYLLYTHRDRPSRAAFSWWGPSPVFLPLHLTGASVVARQEW